MSHKTLNLDVRDGIASVTLNRPDSANALTRRMAAELFSVSVRCSTDRSIRAVVLTATGPMFCAGGDLKEFNGQQDNLPSYLTETASILHSAIVRFQNMDAPLVIAVNGTAAGAGLSMVLSGDYVIAAEHAKFVSAYTASGLTPDGSSTYFLAKHVGLLRAKELMLTNRVLGAAEAREWGIVTEVVDGEQLAEIAAKRAASFAGGPGRAFGATKRLLLTAFSSPIEGQLEAETQAIVAMAGTEDGKNGIDAFANKTRPKFVGN